MVLLVLQEESIDGEERRSEGVGQKNLALSGLPFLLLSLLPDEDSGGAGLALSWSGLDGEETGGWGVTTAEEAPPSRGDEGEPSRSVFAGETDGFGSRASSSLSIAAACNVFPEKIRSGDRQANGKEEEEEGRDEWSASSEAAISPLISS